MIITIDGPCVSGKSSVARQIALKLGICHFSTGLLYRAVAFVLMQGLHGVPAQNHGIDLSNIDFNFISEIKCVVKNQIVHILFGAQDITLLLSDDQLSLSASALSALPEVRQRLLDVQRNLGIRFDIVVDGRDCGSVVFPNADFKFFLTASVDARVKRMMNDQKRAAQNKDYEHIRDEIIKRDERDRTRAIAPLVVPEGAVVVDSSDLTLEQTVEQFLAIIQEKAS